MSCRGLRPRLGTPARCARRSEGRIGPPIRDPRRFGPEQDNRGTDRGTSLRLTYRSSADRARALPHWLDHYNQHRPHGDIGDVAPVTRVRNVSGQDI